MFVRIAFNFFYGIFSDCISVVGFYGNFSTTSGWMITSLGGHGRYCILYNFNGAIEPSPSIRRNSLSVSSTTHYYHTHLEESVQGVRSTICQIGGTFGNYYENRCEATASGGKHVGRYASCVV